MIQKNKVAIQTTQDQEYKGVFSVSKTKAQVHYCDHALSVIRPSVRC